MKVRLLATLTVLAALFAVALPAQAAPYQRHRLGATVTEAERAAYGCNFNLEGSFPQGLLIRGLNGRFSIAKVGTVKHQHRIVDVCLWAQPHKPWSRPTPAP